MVLTMEMDVIPGAKDSIRMFYFVLLGAEPLHQFAKNVEITIPKIMRNATITIQQTIWAVGMTVKVF